MPTFGTSFNTINSMSIWRGLNAPGAPVSDFTYRMAKEVAVTAKAAAPVNNPLNALHRGGVVGTYKSSFVVITGPHNTLQEVTFIAGNRSDHADIVERGKPYVRKRQVFTWQHAVSSKRIGTRGAGGRFAREGRAAFGFRRPDPGGRVSTKVVHAWGYRSKYNPSPAPRGGHRTLTKAADKVARANGLRRNLKLTL